MSELFLTIVNRSISAGWIVLVVLLLRPLFKKAPKWITVLLWGIVAVRLVCPFSIESALSLMPSAETIHPQALIQTPEINTGIPAINNTLNPLIQESTVMIAPEKSVNTFKLLIQIFSMVWMIGVVLFLAYTVFSSVRFTRKVGTAVLLRDNIYQCETVASPFVLGIIKPKIYLPFHMAAVDMEQVIAHEQAHLRRKDHWWKPIGFFLLTLHWFNPLMWVGYILLCRDIELACDEKVVKNLSCEERADYSQALLTCSVNRRTIAACPLAFGEVGVKSRVRSVLNYKKPAFWIIAVAILLMIVAAACFLTNPRTSIPDELSVFLDMRIMEHHQSEESKGNFSVIDYEILDVRKSLNETSMYMWVLYQEYSYAQGEIKVEGGAHTPTVITAKRSGSHGHYKLIEYWQPRDGSYYEKDIKKKFPWYLHSKAIDSQRYIKSQLAKCLKSAEEYFATSTKTDSTEVVITYDDIDKLQAKFPMYFDLSTTKGLEVYIWQMAEGSYSCALLPGRDLIYTNKELWDLHKSPASLDEMKTIVASYIPEISKNDVVIRPIQMPHSSYGYKIDESYCEKITNLFWSDFPIIQLQSYRPTADTKP